MKVNKFPTKCNICGGTVIYTTNDKIYHGKSYGSGYCYLCTCCGAYVGTHKPRPREALGLLADKQMRLGKMYCHKLFDKKWKNKRGGKFLREKAYKELAEKLSIPFKECHFGYFDIKMLRKSYKILLNKGEINK